MDLQNTKPFRNLQMSEQFSPDAGTRGISRIRWQNGKTVVTRFRECEDLEREEDSFFTGWGLAPEARGLKEKKECLVNTASLTHSAANDQLQRGL